LSKEKIASTDATHFNQGPHQ